jgi:hypothetical protein
MSAYAITGLRASARRFSAGYAGRLSSPRSARASQDIDAPQTRQTYETLPDLCQIYGEPNFLLYSVHCHTYHTYHTYFVESPLREVHMLIDRYIPFPTAKSWAEKGLAGMVGLAQHPIPRAAREGNLSNIKGLTTRAQAEAIARPTCPAPDLTIPLTDARHP